jgi:hypothetical protein
LPFDVRLWVILFEKDFCCVWYLQLGQIVKRNKERHMGLPSLGQQHYATACAQGVFPQEGSHNLRASEQEAFLELGKATEAIRDNYGAAGLRDHAGKQRVVRVVKLPEGMPIFKFSGGLDSADEPKGPLPPGPGLTNLFKQKVLLKRAVLSPWWSPCKPFEEDTGGVVEHFNNMTINAVAATGYGKLTMREYMRFSSAVRREWNALNYYAEVTLKKEILAYWGQFEEQPGSDYFTAGQPDPAGWYESDNSGTIEKTETGYFITYPNEEGKFFLPEHVGGNESWQFFIPSLVPGDIDVNSVLVLPATVHRHLAAHFGCPNIIKDCEKQRRQFRQIRAEAMHLRKIRAGRGE